MFQLQELHIVKLLSSGPAINQTEEVSGLPHQAAIRQPSDRLKKFDCTICGLVITAEVGAYHG